MSLRVPRRLIATSLPVLVATLALLSCREIPDGGTGVSWRSDQIHGFLDTLQHRTFLYFWELGDTTRGLTPDRAPARSFVSTGAMGFALTAYPIGAEHRWVSRAAARERTLATFRFLWSAPQDSSSNAAGYRGFYYHFLDPVTGRRFERVELSTMDTALLLAGVLFCQSYFDRDDPAEAALRALADSLVHRVDWRWAQPRPPVIALGWNPESGHLPYDWRGYNEALLLHVLALGSPTHAVGPETWDAWTSRYRWGTFEGQEQLGFAPLFGHQYSHAWIDFRGIHDSYMRARGIDYFENSRRATLSQRAYAVRNPGAWAGYGARVWGLSACDGPKDTTLTLNGQRRSFRTYSARGASFTGVEDDGTLTPTAAGGSITFAPEIAIPALLEMRARWGDHLVGRYGFFDAFNPSLTEPMPVQHGRIVPGVGWFDTDYLGIDQGPILIMIENLRSGLVWKHMKKNPNIVRGLRRAGFTGGWLDRAPATP
ncbi:MAG: glucoamylase family protein [Candidatus Eisenbacteria bacterium]